MFCSCIQENEGFSHSCVYQKNDSKASLSFSSSKKSLNSTRSALFIFHMVVFRARYRKLIICKGFAIGLLAQCEMNIRNALNSGINMRLTQRCVYLNSSSHYNFAILIFDGRFFCYSVNVFNVAEQKKRCKQRK